MKRNVHELPEWIDLVYSLGATCAEIRPVMLGQYTAPSLKEELLENCPDTARHYLKLAIERAKTLGLRVYLDAIRFFLPEEL